MNATAHCWLQSTATRPSSQITLGRLVITGCAQGFTASVASREKTVSNIYFNISHMVVLVKAILVGGRFGLVGGRFGHCK